MPERIISPGHRGESRSAPQQQQQWRGRLVEEVVVVGGGGWPRLFEANTRGRSTWKRAAIRAAGVERHASSTPQPSLPFTNTRFLLMWPACFSSLCAHRDGTLGSRSQKGEGGGEICVYKKKEVMEGRGGHLLWKRHSRHPSLLTWLQFKTHAHFACDMENRLAFSFLAPGTEAYGK